jgi:hypothetical protein
LWLTVQVAGLEATVLVDRRFAAAVAVLTLACNTIKTHPRLFVRSLNN